MITHEEEIQDIVSYDFMILDVVLEKKLRDFYEERGLGFPEWFLRPLLDVIFQEYTKWN